MVDSLQVPVQDAWLGEKVVAMVGKAHTHCATGLAHILLATRNTVEAVDHPHRAA